MPQVVQCPHCQKRFSASDRLAGMRVACGSCKKPIAIPSAPLADLLDDEIKVFADEVEVVATVATPKGPHCIRCKSEMAAGERYCVACGHHNFNAAESVGSGHLEKHKEKERERKRDKAIRTAFAPGLLGIARSLLDD